MNKYVITSLVILLPLLTACNTMEGLGQDMQKGGERIEKSAEQNK